MMGDVEMRDVDVDMGIKGEIMSSSDEEEPVGLSSTWGNLGRRDGGGKEEEGGYYDSEEQMELNEDADSMEVDSESQGRNEGDVYKSVNIGNVHQALEDMKGIMKGQGTGKYAKMSREVVNLRKICLEDLSEEELLHCTETYIIGLGKKGSGVVSGVFIDLLEKMVKDSNNSKHYKDAKCRGYEFLTTLVNRVKRNAIGKNIMRICRVGTQVDKQSVVQEKAYNLLNGVVDICKDLPAKAVAQFIDFGKLFDDYFGTLFYTGQGKSSNTNTGLILQFLGKCCYSFPEFLDSIMDDGKIERLVKYCESTLKEQANEEKMKAKLCWGAFSCLNCVYKRIPFAEYSEFDEDDSYIDDADFSNGKRKLKVLYSLTIKVIRHQLNLARKEKVGDYGALKGALELFASLGKSTACWLFHESNKIYQLLLEDCANLQNRDVKSACRQAGLAFIECVSEYMTKRCDQRESRRQLSVKVLDAFLFKFRALVRSKAKDSNMWFDCLCIRGYAFLAKPCGILLNEEQLNTIFDDIMVKTAKLFNRQTKGKEYETNHEIPDHICSASLVIRSMKSVSDAQLERIQGFVTNVFQMISFKGSAYKYAMCISLTFQALEGKANVDTSFLQRVVFSGVYETLNGLALASRINEDFDRMETEKVYMDLWKRLIDPNLRIMSDYGGIYSNMGGELTRHIIVEKISDAYIYSILKILDRLNFELKVVEKEIPKAREANTGDLMEMKIPEVISDFQFLQGSVGLTKEVMPLIKRGVFAGWGFEYFSKLSLLVEKFPETCGLYSLFSLGIMRLESTDESKEDVVVLGICHEFVQNVLKKVMVYSGELLACCLEVVFALPTSFVSQGVSNFSQAFECGFRIGLVDIPMASLTLDAFEDWFEKFGGNVMSECIATVLPVLNDYLMMSKDAYQQNLSDELRRSAKKRLMTKAQVVNISSGDKAKTPLHKLQIRIMKLIAKFGGSSSSKIIPTFKLSEEIESEVRWGSRFYLDFEIPYEESSVHIYLDEFLPRVAHLAKHSGDRKTKIYACELFHALVSYVIGISTPDATATVVDQSPVCALYLKIFPSMLHLAADSEPIAKFLFYDAMVRVIHWFSGPRFNQSTETSYLLDALMEGVGQDKDSYLRSVCCRLLGEFVKWTTKERSKHLISVLKRLYELVEHPCHVKRMGAYMSFRAFWRMFFNKSDQADVFGLEIFVFVVRSLSLCDSNYPEVNDVASVCVRDFRKVLVRHKDILKVNSGRRRHCPPNWSSIDLGLVVAWLFKHCSSTVQQMRKVCMQEFKELFIHICGKQTTVVDSLMSPPPQTVKIWASANAVDVNNLIKNLEFIDTAPKKIMNLESSSWLCGYLALLGCFQFLVDYCKWSVKDALALVGKKYFCSLNAFVESACLCQREDFLLLNRKERRLRYDAVSETLLTMCFLAKYMHVVGASLNWFAIQTMYCMCLFSPHIFGFDDLNPAHSLHFSPRMKQVLGSLVKMSAPGCLETFVGGWITANEAELDKYDVQHADVNLKELNGIVRGYTILLSGGVLSNVLMSCNNDPAIFPEVLIGKILTLQNGFGRNQEFRNVFGRLLVFSLQANDNPSKVLASLLNLAKEAENAPSSASMRSLDSKHKIVALEVFGDHLSEFCYSRFCSLQKVFSVCNYNNEELVKLLVRTAEYAFAQPSSDEKQVNFFSLLGSLLNEYYVEIYHGMTGYEVEKYCSSLFILLKKYLAFCYKRGMPIPSNTVDTILDEIMFKSPLKLWVHSATKWHVKMAALEALSWLGEITVHQEMKLKDMLNDFTLNCLPRHSKEYAEKSLEQERYLEALEILLNIFERGRYVSVIEVLVGTFFCESEHAGIKSFVKTLQMFCREAPQASIVNVSRKIFDMIEETTNIDTKHHIWNGTLRKVFVWCSEACLVQILTKSRVDSFKSIFKQYATQSSATHISKLSKKPLFNALIILVRTFDCLHILFRRASSENLNSLGLSLAPESPIRKYLASVMIAFETKIDCLKCPEYFSFLYTSLRLFQIYMGLAMFPEDLQKLPVFVYREENSRCCWKLFDDRPYYFSLEVEKFPLDLGKISSENENKLKSFDIEKMETVSSSVDILSFSISGSTGTQRKMASSEGRKIAYDSPGLHGDSSALDKIDAHPCILALLKSLDVCAALYEKSSKKDPKITPKWIQFVCDIMKSAETYDQILDAEHKDLIQHRLIKARLFGARLLKHRANGFKPYKSIFLGPLLQLIVDSKEYGKGINYVTIEHLAVLFDWYLGAENVIVEHGNAVLVGRTFQHLIEYSTLCDEIGSSYQKRYATIVYSFYMCFRKYIDFPILQCICENSDSEKEIPVVYFLILISLLSSEHPFRISDSSDSLHLFCKRAVMAMNGKAKRLAATVCGLILNQLKLDGHQDFEGLQCSLKESLSGYGTQANDKDSGALLQSIYSIQKVCAGFAREEMPMIIHRMFDLNSNFKAMSLSMVADYASDMPDLWDLIGPRINELIQVREEEVQREVLSIIFNALPTWKAEYFSQFLKTLQTAFIKHSSVDLRVQFHKVFIKLYSLQHILRLEQSDRKLLKDSLLFGLVDESASVRSTVYQFWNDDSELPRDINGRLIACLSEIYSPGLEECFVNYASALMLMRCKNSKRYEESLFKVNLLKECKYKKVPLNHSYQGRDAFAGRFLGTVSSVDFGHSVASLALGSDGTLGSVMDSFSMGSFYGNTISQSQQSGGFSFAESNADVTHSKGDESEANATREQEIARLTRPHIKSKDARFFSGLAQRKKKHVTRLEKEQKEARLKEFNSSRNYVGEGDLPDIQITCSDILKPLSELILKDTVLASRLFVSLMTNALAGCSTEVLEIVGEKISAACLESTDHIPSFIAAMHEICIKMNINCMKSALVELTACESNNFQTGIVLLENKLQYLRKMNQEGGADYGATLKSLAEVHRKFGNSELSLAIRTEELCSVGIVRPILQLEKQHRYDEAVIALKQASDADAWDAEVDEDSDSLLFVANIEWLEKLGEWKNLETEVMSLCENFPENASLNLNSLKFLWDPKRRNALLRPFIKSQIEIAENMLSCEGSTDMPRIDFIEETMRKAGANKSVLELHFAPELARHFVMHGDLRRARYYVDFTFNTFLCEWSTLHPLMIHSRKQKLAVLMKICEIDELINIERVIKSSQCIDILESNRWTRRFPDPRLGSVQLWNDIFNQRKCFSRCIKEVINELPNGKSFEGNIEGFMYSVGVSSYLQFSNALLEQNETSLGLRRVNQAINWLEKQESPDCTNIGEALLLKLQLLMSAISVQVKESYLVDCVNSVALLRDCLERTHPDCIQILKIAEVEGRVMQAMLKSMDSIGKLSTEMKKSFEMIGIRVDSVEEAKSSLDRHILGIYENADGLNAQSGITHFPAMKARVQVGFAEYLLKISKSDDRFKALNDRLDAICETRIMTLLVDAFIMGDLAAKEKFPIVLKMLHNDRHIPNEVWTRANTMATHDLVQWVPKLIEVAVSGASEESKDLVLLWLKKVAKSFPQRIYYPLSVCKQERRLSGPLLSILDDVRNPVLDRFVEELHNLTSPHHRLRIWCSKMENEIQLEPAFRKRKAVCDLFDELCSLMKPTSIHKTTGSKTMLAKFCDTFSSLIFQDWSVEYFLTVTLNEFKKSVDFMFGKMSSAKFKKDFCPPSISLSAFSPWMSMYNSTDWEHTIIVPAKGYEYGENRMKDVYITSFEQDITIMRSVRAPKRLVLRGSDEREYPVLVKAGEDLRRDQKIITIFRTVNKILTRNSCSVKMNLRLRVYSVVPISLCVGLIEWIPQTQSLGNFLRSTLTEEEKNSLYTVMAEMGQFIEQKRSERPEIKSWGRLYCSDYDNEVKENELKTHFLKAVEEIPEDLSRNAFSALVNSTETYVVLRQHFCSSYAVMCICHYILGVGDRHLDNFMISLSNGEIIGIDFDKSFGDTVRTQIIPELVPFRLTSQIEMLFAPLNRETIFKADMTNALTALQREKDVLVYLIEEENFQDETDVVRKKLNGLNPASVILHEFKNHPMASDQQIGVAIERVRKLVTGETMEMLTGSSTRRKIEKELNRNHPDSSLSFFLDTEKQISYLLEQASDPSILVRLYTGWTAWM
eukprot:Nk52_evm14s2622 gene=Nk52_evmTU14s2622